MLTRREEDVAIVEIEVKNTELVTSWAEGKEGARGAERTDNRQGPTEREPAEGSENIAEGGYRAGGEEAERPPIGGPVEAPLGQ